MIYNINLERFIAVNGKMGWRILVILDEVMQKFPSVPWDKLKITSYKNNGYGGYFVHKPFALNFYVSPWITNKDLRFLVYHEVGHLLDYVHGDMQVDEENRVFFKGKLQSAEFANDILAEANMHELNCNDEDAKFMIRVYASLPSEYSANCFAVAHCPYIPDDGNFEIMYKVASGEIPLYRF